MCFQFIFSTVMRSHLTKTFNSLKINYCFNAQHSNLTSLIAFYPQRIAAAYFQRSFIFL